MAEATNFPLPEGGSWLEFKGRFFYQRTWKSAVQPPRAVVVAIHGIGEHVDRYDVLFSALAKAGVQVYGYDQRGFGRTGHKSKPLGHTDGWENVMGDVDGAVKRSKIDGVPTFLFGHSMGGMIVLNYALDHQKEGIIQGVISSAPAIDVHSSVKPIALTRRLALIAGHVVPTFAMNTNLNVDHLSHDPKVSEEYLKSPFNHGLASITCLNDMFLMGPRLMREAPNFTTPILLAHGDEDLLTSCEASIQFHSLLPADTDKTLQVWNGCKHEPHNEPKFKDAVPPLIIEWISKRV